MKPKATLLTFFAFTLSLLTTQADHHGAKKAFDLAGSWEAKAETDNGTNEYTFSFEKKDDKWTGKSEDENGREREMDRIKIDGQKFVLETDVESNGQEGIIRVTAEANEAGDQFKGKWAVVGSDDSELMSGSISGVKEYQLDLEGEWDSVAMVDSEEKSSKTTFKKDGKKWTGGFKGDDNEAKFSKVTTDGKKVTCEFVMPIRWPGPRLPHHRRSEEGERVRRQVGRV